MYDTKFLIFEMFFKIKWQNLLKFHVKVTLSPPWRHALETDNFQKNFQQFFAKNFFKKLTLMTASCLLYLGKINEQ